MSDVKRPMSGMESMLRSMGFGPVLDAANTLAQAGTLDKILKFADGLEGLNERLTRIERQLEALNADAIGELYRLRAAARPGPETRSGNGSADAGTLEPHGGN